MALASRTAIMGIFVVANRALTASQAIALAAPLGISATNVKSHLTRMVADGVLQREGRARLAIYKPTEERDFIIGSIRERLNNPHHEPWDSTWLILAVQPPKNRSERSRLLSALWFDGFRPLSGNIVVRPAWPLAWSEERAYRYTTNGSGICLRGTIISGQIEFSSLYNLKALDAEARNLAARIRRKAASTSARNMSPSKAFAERIRAGSDVVQLIAHDPRLPEALWGNRSGMRELAHAYADFETLIAKPAGDFLKQVLAGTALRR